MRISPEMIEASEKAFTAANGESDALYEAIVAALALVETEEPVAYRFADGGGYNADWRYSTHDPREYPHIVEESGASCLSSVKPLYLHPSPAVETVEPSGETIMKTDVERMILDWQTECADYPALHNQGNVLLGRLKELKPSLAMSDFLSGIDALIPQAPVAWTDTKEIESVSRYGSGLIWDKEGHEQLKLTRPSVPLYASSPSPVGADAIIERCAQVAENFLPRLTATMEIPPSQYDIAAAIRALKSSPKQEQPEKNPKLEYIPDDVGKIGDEFTRRGITYRIVGEPSSDGEVALCLRLEADPINDYQTRVAEAAMFVTDDDVERACALFYGNWEAAPDKDVTRFAMRQVLEVFVFKSRERNCEKFKSSPKQDNGQVIG